jgi:peptidoglycan hydrolase CwlO-like protein
MTHAEQYSTVEPGACPARRNRTRNRVLATLALASALGATSVVFAPTTPASADQISDAQSKAAAITAQLNAAQAQIAALTGQVNQADYKLSQLNDQIAASQAQMAKDQHEVAKDQGQLRTQAIADYTSSGTSNTATQLFTSNVNTSGIRSEYSSIATGNVTSTIAHLHTAQAELAATQASLEQQKSQAQTERSSLASAQSQASALAAQDKSTLASVDANIQSLVAQKQAAQAAAQVVGRQHAGRAGGRAGAPRPGHLQPEGPAGQGRPGPADDDPLRWPVERRWLGWRNHRADHPVGSPAPAGVGCRRCRAGRRT